MPVSDDPEGDGRAAAGARARAARRSAAGSIRSSTLPRLGELDRVGQQVAQHLPQPRVVGEQVGRDARGGGDREVQALLRGHRPEGGLDVVEQLAQRDPLGVDVHLAGLDLGQVEDVVDQLQQVGARRVDDARVLDLLGGEVAGGVLGQQLGEDQQAVERGAQLVAHVGQELRLVLGGQRELLGAVLQLLPGLLDLQVLGLDVAVLRWPAAPPSPPARRWSAAAPPAGPAAPRSGPAVRRSAAGTPPAARRCGRWRRWC